MTFSEAFFLSTDTVDNRRTNLHTSACNIGSSTHQSVSDVLDGMNEPLSAGFIADSPFDELYPEITDQGNLFDNRLNA